MISNIIRKLCLGSIIGILVAGIPVYSASVSDIANQVSRTSYQDYLDKALYTHTGDDRAYGLQHDMAMTNILNTLASFGLKTTLEPFTYQDATYYNVVGVLPGKSARSNEVYIISSHYDSAMVNEELGVPGADDDGSGVAGMLEAARVLSQHQFGATLVFAAFDREEDGVVGSGEYVVRHQQDDIKGAVVLDMIAHNNTPNRPEICCMEQSKPLMLALSNSISLYGGGLSVSYGGVETNADNISFESNGFQACLLFEGGKNPYYHTIQDTVDTPNYIDYDFATKLTRSTVGWAATEAGLITQLPPDTNATWTILVYGHADHNLSPSLIRDMNEMEQVGSGNGFNIVVQADFDSSQPNDGLPKALASGVTRFLMKQDSDTANITSPAVERLAESTNMDNPDTLTDFVTWAIEKYPTSRYGLVLWNHGGQWQGFGGDTQDGTVNPSAILSTKQIRQALSSAMQTAGLAKFEFVGFDTCLMGGVEILPDMVPLTDLFIACAELDYGDGWDYAAPLAGLKENPAIRTLDIGIQEVITWQAHHMRPENQSDLALASHAAYDLTQFNDFAGKFNAFGDALNQIAIPENTWIPEAVLQTTHYSISKIEESGKATDYLDLGEFAKRLSGNSLASASFKTAANALVASIDKMVIAKVLGTTKTNSMGLSVYYPVEGSKNNSQYLDLNMSKLQNATWPSLLATVAQNRSQDTNSPAIAEAEETVGLNSISTNANKLTASVQQPALIHFSIDSSEEVFGYRGAIVDRQLARQTNSFVYVGEVIYTTVRGAGKYQFQWNATLPTLSSDVNSESAILGGFFDEVDGNIMTSYANYLPPGSTESYPVVLITALTGTAGGRVIGVLDAEAEDEGLAPEGIELEAGGKLKPIYYMEQRVGNDPDQWVGDDFVSNTAITIPTNGIEGLRLSLRQVPDGVYTLEVQAQDFYENESDPLIFDITVISSGPKLQITSLAGGKIKLLWPSSATNFVPQISTNLKTGSWSDLPTSEITIEGSNNVLVQSKTSGALFYRLISK